MLTGGLVEEVTGLLAQYGQLGRTAAQAVGYREVIDHLTEKNTLAETTALIQAHTRQFARRQEIWFRGLKELQPVVVTPDSPIDELADSIVNIFTTQEASHDNAGRQIDGT